MIFHWHCCIPAAEGPVTHIFHETIGIIKKNPSLGIALVSSLTEPEDFLLGLESGIYNFINTPCRKNYFLKRIEEIIGSVEIEGRDKPFLFSFDYRGRSYSFEIPQFRLASALLSTMENSLHQNRILIDSLKKKPQTGAPEGK